MRCFHRTPEVDSILADGFQDSEGTYGTTHSHRGVWVSDTPLDEDEGSAGDTLLLAEVPEEVFMQYWWVQKGKPYREALIPASILNRYPVARWTQDQEDEYREAQLRQLYLDLLEAS